MDRDRSTGYILATEEYEHDVWELAVPVRSPKGDIVASLSVLGSRLDAGRSIDEVADALQSASKRLGSSIGSPD